MADNSYEILIVDDTKTMRMIVQAVLSEMDANFEQAEDGQIAFEMIKQKQYDLIISDIHMPNMSGLELCQQVRQQLKFKNLPILVITTDHEYDTVEKVFNVGATDFIIKPLNELELISRVERILDQRKIEKQLYVAQNKADQASQLKSSYLAHVNHELKTPLNGIYGYAQLLHSQETEPKKLLMLDMMIKSSEQMTTMVNQLLELEQIESGHVSVVQEEFPLLEVVQKCVLLNKPQLEEKSLLLFDNVDDSLTVCSDKTLLFSVVSNLLSNAIKYNQSGGSISIDSVVDNKQVLLNIKDTGIGMSNEQLATIYEPFSRFVDEKSEEKGHGLGMAITKSTADALGMQLNISSEIDKGTKVSLSF